MEYLTTTEMSKLWNLSSRRIGVLCTEGRIDGAIKKERCGCYQQMQLDQQMRDIKQINDQNST